ncbi:hypothetical protein N7467_001893 [Penicillium canescens]|nr:hypothetical protein N7467_001893 [Penicillium canescens]
MGKLSRLTSGRKAKKKRKLSKHMMKDFDPISDDEEITNEVSEDHDVAGEEAALLDVLVTETSLVRGS